MRRNSLAHNLRLRARLTQFAVMGLPWRAVCWTGATAITAIVFTVPAQAAILSQWEYNPSSYELEILVPGGTIPRYSLAAEPARIIIDLPNTNIGTVSHQQAYGGAVREIRVSQYEPGLTRIVLELSPGTVLAPGHVELRRVGATTGGSDEPGDRWVLRPLLVTDSLSQTAPEVPSAAPAPLAEQPALSSETVADTLPPLEPNALEIPVEMPPAAPVADVPATERESVPSEADRTVGANVLPELEPESESEIVTVPELTQPEVADADLEITDLEIVDSEIADSEIAGLSEPEIPDIPEVSDVPVPSGVAIGTEPELMEAPIAVSPEESTEPESSTEIPVPSRSALPSLGIEAVLPEEAIQNTLAAIEAGEVDAPQSLTTPEIVEPPLELALPSSPESIAQSQPPEESGGIATSEESREPEAELPALPPSLPAESDGTIVQVPSLAEAATDTDTTNHQEPVSADAGGLDESEVASSTNIDRAIQTVPEAAIAVSPSSSSRLIEFGQPLTAANPSSVSAAEHPVTELPQPSPASPQAPVLLPIGTILRLRYPGVVPMELAEGQSRQEVLVLAAPVQDAAGNLILPEGSYVIGRFEAQPGRRWFVTQAISIQGRNVLLSAESGNLLSEPSPADDRTSQSPIQPDQVLEVQLTEHLSRSSRDW